MYAFPSSSKSRAFSPRAMKSGSPTTPLKARTGESTPREKRDFARLNSRADASVLRNAMAGWSNAAARHGQSPLLSPQLGLGVVAVRDQLHLPAVLIAVRVLGELLDRAAGDVVDQPPLARAARAAEDDVLGAEGAGLHAHVVDALGRALDALLRELLRRVVVVLLLHGQLVAFCVVGELGAHAHELLPGGIEQALENRGLALVVGELHLPPLAALRVVEEVGALDADAAAVLAMAAPARVLPRRVGDLRNVVAARRQGVGEDESHVDVEEGGVHRRHAHAAAAVAGGRAAGSRAAAVGSALGSA